MTRRSLALFAMVDGMVSCVLAILFRNASNLGLLLNFARRHQTGVDSKLYMDMAWEAWNAGKPIYHFVFFQQHFKFIYPTSSLLLYRLATFVHLSPHGVLGVTVLLSWAVVVACSGMLMLLRIRKQQSDLKIENRWIWSFAVLICLLFFPLTDALRLGQIQTLLTALWVLAVILWMKERKGSAGILLALICAFKPTLAVFAVWALVRKEWKFLWSFLAATFLIQAVSIAVFGWQNEIDYLRVLSYISHHGEAYAHNQSFNGLMQRSLRNGDATTWRPTIYPPYNPIIYLGTIITTAALFLFGLLTPVLRGWKDRTLDFVLFGMISTVASPIAWEHHYSYFLVAILIVFASKSIRPPQLVFFAGCAMIVGNAFPFYSALSNTPWTLLTSLGYFAGLGMITVVAASLSRSRPDQIEGYSLR